MPKRISPPSVSRRDDFDVGTIRPAVTSDGRLFFAWRVANRLRFPYIEPRDRFRHDPRCRSKEPARIPLPTMIRTIGQALRLPIVLCAATGGPMAFASWFKRY
ncbi:hypothetical protein AB4Z01_31330 [Inquilinus sp. YAF38]|uniref:hypothetical protein n=1 Tax=Inquilinus sp. YAF38 TaxID=3233084 RepID=UPI003F933F44